LDESRNDCAEQAWLRMLTALPRLFGRDAEVYSSFVEADERGRSVPVRSTRREQRSSANTDLPLGVPSPARQTR
jgi:hypothetical protein